MNAMHRRGWAWLGLVGVLGMVAAFTIIATYPIPDIPTGWCSSGERPGHYAVQSVTETVLYLDVVAAAAVVIAAGACTGRLGLGLVVSVLTALPVGAFLLFTALIYAGRIDCAFS